MGKWQIVFNIIVLIGLAGVISFTSFQLIINLLKENQALAVNYQQRKVPCPYGLSFAITLIVGFLVGSFSGYYSYEQVNKLLILILTMSFVGIIDDLLGNKQNQGLVGHFKVLLTEFKLTTGSLKAVFSSIVVFSVSLYWSTGLWAGILNGLIFLLSANFINLLDVRPGRALKIVIIIISLIIVSHAKLINYGLLVLITVVRALPVDLAGQGMMGDVGANVLGVVVGFLVVAGFSEIIKLVYLISLMAIHLYTEVRSLSNLIKNNKILCQLDQLGRKN